MEIDLLDGPQARRLQSAIERTMAGDTMEDWSLINELVLLQLQDETNERGLTW